MRVGIVGQNSEAFVSILLKTWAEGKCAVLIDGRTPEVTAIDLLIKAEVDLCYLDKTLKWGRSNLEKIKFKIIYVDFSCKGIVRLSDNIRKIYKKNNAKNEAVIIYSSGTTGPAKGIILSHYAICKNADSISKYMISSRKDRIYIVRPLVHSSSLIGELLVGLRKGVDIYLSSTTIIPRIMISNIQENAISIVGMNPWIFTNFINELTRKAHKFDNLKKVLIYGAAIEEDILLKGKSLLPNTNIYCGYGLTEAGPRVSSQRKKITNLGSVGKPISGVKVQIYDGAKKIKVPNHVGEIYVKTKSSYIGYVEGKEKVHSSINGWINTGDSGFWDERHELHIKGRVDDEIILNAHKIYPQDVENVIHEKLSVNECVVGLLEIDDRKFLGCAYIRDSEIKPIEIQALATVLLPFEIPRIFSKIESIPRNMNGKIDRNATMKELYKKVLR